MTVPRAVEISGISRRIWYSAWSREDNGWWLTIGNERHFIPNVGSPGGNGRRVPVRRLTRALGHDS